jgi:hypothetical protein
VELEELEEKIQQRGFLDGLVLRMRRDSSKQSELEQGLQAAADEKFQGVCVVFVPGTAGVRTSAVNTATRCAVARTERFGDFASSLLLRILPEAAGCDVCSCSVR